MKEIIVFDFDDTLYDGDSSIDFYIFCLKENLLLIRYLPIQVFGIILYKFRIKSKEFCKERFFSFLKGISNIDQVIERFWEKKAGKIKKEMLNNKVNIVVISASPSFLLEPICRKLNIEKVIATKVDKKTGRFLSKNCFAEEKVNRLNCEYSNYIIQEFYSDSKSDVYLAQNSKKSFLVKKRNIIEWI